MRDVVLVIDLNNYTYEVEHRPELFEKWLGGTGVAVQLMREHMDPKADPLSPENVIVFATGPLTPAYPLASKTVAMFKSPLTGNLGESHAGGRTAVSIAAAGYGAIVIKGASKKPVYLVVEPGKVHFRDGRVLWGIPDSLIVGRILAENESGRGTRTMMRIGGAGERLVRYSCVTTETYRHFGRLGLGAVFGSKKLKALIVRGRKKYLPADGKKYREVYDEIYRMAIESDAMKKYHLLGTAANVIPLNELNALPTKNLKAARFEKAEEISGEALAEHNLGRRIACSHCPVACIHLAALRLPYENEPYFFRTIMISYDYELIYSLGSMLGIGRRDDLLRLIHRVETYGLDAMSTGVCLAWATEALERGIITERETLVKLNFGDVESYLKAIDYIYEQPTEFYKHLAMGVQHASEIYGGREFALAFGGNEMPGYHTGYAAVLGYLTGMRHSHLDSAGYSLDQKVKDLSPEEVINRLIEEESWRQVLSSLVVCFFARGIYTPEVISRAFEPLGYSISPDELKNLGTEIYREKARLKVAMGFNPKKLSVPKRIFETPSLHGKLSEEFMARALDYYRKRLEEML
ncbi:aldehyde ferredoxin oxidoreductase family protein [Archaeoglobus fulgidus]|uniref:Aldehyde ferredoxin oxidoreductase (Aor-2) n=2 Tax=Archaeoglobus fulgidus TaxID=2234 RepID=O30159_ARCFU|nr:aldehyde ferredoxin oxidoreductase family protein [Archaeoglobus fulgidus]AAB91151.1 aldehyde ferredoxin oxidoreductase (aor-2) [Archaeoglobus fulgidus DSM 4304]AIG96917.1 Aldehyde:ferredoxin oxidoreductase [Archaeoglobus fulgidus DSM 8774]